MHLDASAFDLAYYLEHNPDVAESGRDPFAHFLEHGVYENRQARFFDTSWYLRRYPDLMRGHVDAFTHFQRFGQSEGRSAQFLTFKTTLVRPSVGNYSDWVRQFDEIGKTDLKWLEARAAELAGPSFGILMVDAGTAADSGSLITSFNSIFDQILPPAAIHLVGQLSSFRVRDSLAQLGKKAADVACHDIDEHLAEALNAALERMGTDFVVIMDGGDVLSPMALYCLTEALAENPEAEILYSDEDRIDVKGRRSAPYFKCKPNPELLLTHNMIGHLAAYKASLLQLIQGFDSHHEGAAEYDLALRAVESTSPDMIVHIPRVLYHRLKTGEPEMGTPPAHLAAVRSYLNRRNLEGTVTPAPEVAGYSRVRLKFSGRPPLVSVIIPTRDHVDVLKVCVASLLERTTYPGKEIIIVDNGSENPETLQYLKRLQEENGIIVVRDPRPFNFAALNNAAVARARGEFVCLMNNDIEIITPDWLEEMLSFARNPDVGCVGARLWYPDGTLQHGGVLVGFHGVAGHMHKYLKKGDTGYANRAVLHQSLSAVTAACLLVSKANLPGGRRPRRGLRGGLQRRRFLPQGARRRLP